MPNVKRVAYRFRVGNSRARTRIRTVSSGLRCLSVYAYMHICTWSDTPYSRHDYLIHGSRLVPRHYARAVGILQSWTGHQSEKSRDAILGRSKARKPVRQ